MRHLVKNEIIDSYFTTKGLQTKVFFFSFRMSVFKIIFMCSQSPFCGGLRNRSKRIRIPVVLLCSLSGKYHWERYEPPYPPCYGLNRTTTVLRRCPWCNCYRRRKWTRRHEFKSWTKLITFHIALIPLGKVWIQLFSLQLWVNSRTD